MPFFYHRILLPPAKLYHLGLKHNYLILASHHILWNLKLKCNNHQPHKLKTQSGERKIDRIGIK